jgi:hypothetical protein
MTPVDIRQIALKFQKGAVELGQVRLHGPLDLAKQEGKLDLELSGVDRRLLNLVANTQGLDAILQLCGAPGGMAAYVQGMDFGATALSSTNHIELGAGGKNLAVSGQFHGKSVSVARQGVATPVLDLAAAYNVTVDQVQQNAWLREFTLDASSAQKPLLRGALSKPMKFDWKSGANAVEESALTVTLSGFDLRDYRAFLGTNLVSGVINGTLDLQAKAAGKQLFIKLNAAGADLAAVAGSNRVSGLGFQLDSGLTLNNFQKLQINRTEFKLRHGTTELASASATGNADVKSQDLVLAINARVSLPGLLGLAPAAGTPLTAGTLTFDASLKQENLTLPNSKTAAFARSVEGKLDLANLSGTAGGCQFERYDAAIAFDAVLKNNVSTVRKASGTIKQAGQAAGSFESQAEYDTATGAAKFSLKLAGLNENALRPFLAAALGDKSLASVAINSELTGGYDPAAQSTIKGDLSVTNLVIKDPAGRVPATPLEARFKLDAGLRQQVAELRDCTLTLTPTARGKNAVQVKGTVDFSKTNAITGALDLLADTLDFTHYYDLFMAAPGTPAKPASATAAARPAADANAEPIAQVLPLRDFVTRATINRLYLRDLEVANFQTAVKLDGGKTLVQPFQATLNGAPVNGTVDLQATLNGVPVNDPVDPARGLLCYAYNVSFSATAVPIPPLVSLAMPQRAGQFGGTATLELKELKGNGVSGANLQKNLAGEFLLLTTNLNFSLHNARSAALKSIVNVVVGIPDIIRNPTAAIGNLLAKLTGTPATGAAGGWADQLLQSPLNSIVLRGRVGSGQVKLTEASL